MYKTLNIKDSKVSTINESYCARVQRFTKGIQMKYNLEIKKLKIISVTSFKEINAYKKRDFERQVNEKVSICTLNTQGINTKKENKKYP